MIPGATGLVGRLTGLRPNWSMWALICALICSFARPLEPARGQSAVLNEGPNDLGALLLAEPGLVTAIAPGPSWPSDQLLLVALGDRFARSTDGGHSWDFLPAPGPVLSLTLVPILERTPIAFASAGQSLYRSTDLGATWLAVAPRPDILLPSPDFSRDRRVFSLNSGALARSIDGGMTWADVNLGEGWRAQELVLSQSFLDDRTLFASVSDLSGTFQVLTSADGGASWTAASAAVGPEDLLASEEAIHLAPYTVGGAPVSDSLQAVDGLLRFQVEALTMSPDYARDGTLFASARGVDGLPRTMQCAEPRVGALFRSTDRGATWQLAVAVDSPPCGRAPEVVVSPNFVDDGIAFLRYTFASTPDGTFCYLYQSDDWGASWRKSGPMLGLQRTPCLTSLTLGRRNGVPRSTPTAAVPPAPPPGLIATAVIATAPTASAVATPAASVPPTDVPEWVIAAGGSINALVDPIPARLSLVPLGNQIVVLNPLASNYMRPELRLSRDGGRSWELSSFGVTARAQDGTVFYGNSSGVGILKSMDPTGVPVIAEFPLPTGASSPTALAPGPDGALWFTERLAKRVGRISVEGDVTEYPLPVDTTLPFTAGLTAGPDGALWFSLSTSVNDGIGRITTEGKVTQYPLPGERRLLGNMAAGPDGAIWFAEQASGHRGIGRITTSGEITEYALDRAPGQAITAGPDGALWFSILSGSGIGRITTDGVVTEYALPTSAGSVSSMVAAQDGALWFTGGNRIGRITGDGKVTEYPVPTRFPAPLRPGGPTSITVGPDRALWFIQGSRNKVGRITLDGNITVDAVTTPGFIGSLVTGPDGALWFIDLDTRMIGRIAISASGP